jgi:hypothetical protein
MNGKEEELTNDFLHLFLGSKAYGLHGVDILILNILHFDNYEDFKNSVHHCLLEMILHDDIYFRNWQEMQGFTVFIKNKMNWKKIYKYSANWLKNYEYKGEIITHYLSDPSNKEYIYE